MPRMKNLLRTTIASFALLLVAGCASHKEHSTPAVGMLNSKCLVSGEPIEASSPTADYMGGKVGFCCDKCLAKWNSMDAAAKKAAFDAKK